eukprot:TRINITY_DN778144_c0_g1_i1.p1 TRINITY_DN778144_c0_g1~~TRINITY_DN778144_c0_g1_i1.p1  ORF type:complete len:133 (-),score=53.99 TRINITY_DN778144_c0_g1_i1:190-588(-)
MMEDMEMEAAVMNGRKLNDEDFGGEEEEEEPYYWEIEQQEEPSAAVKGWHHVHWFGMKVFNGLEFCGEVVAEFLGLNDSKFQYVIDQMEREKERNLEFELEMKQRDKLIKEAALKKQNEKLKKMEESSSCPV